MESIFTLSDEFGVFFVVGSFVEFFNYFHFFVVGEEVGDFSVVKQVWKIFDHLLLHNLGVWKEEYGFFLVNTAVFHKFLQFFFPVSLVYLVGLFVGYERRKSG